MGETPSHFDDRAATWDDDPDTVRRATDVADAVVAALPLRPGMRLLEYGAGTGLVTQAVLARVGDLEVTLVDTSSGMRKVLGDKIVAGALPAGSRVWGLDLQHDPVPAGEEVDVVLSSMVLHHVHDLDTVLGALSGLLAPGGHLAVADLAAEDGSFHAHHHDFDGHHGFEAEDLRARLEAAGLTGVSVTEATSIEKEGTTYPVLLATGCKGAPHA